MLQQFQSQGWYKTHIAATAQPTTETRRKVLVTLLLHEASTIGSAPAQVNQVQHSPVIRQMQ